MSQKEMVKHIFITNPKKWFNRCDIFEILEKTGAETTRDSVGQTLIYLEKHDKFLVREKSSYYVMYKKSW